MNHVFFEPWEGEHYRRAGLFGKRVLIMGESHYEWDPKIRPYRELTRDCIREQLDGRLHEVVLDQDRRDLLTQAPNVG